MSPAGMALGLNSIPGLTGTAGLGDATETEEERRKRLGMVAQQRWPAHPARLAGRELVVRFAAERL
jgi:hypothetical protein